MKETLVVGSLRTFAKIRHRGEEVRGIPFVEEGGPGLERRSVCNYAGILKKGRQEVASLEKGGEGGRTSRKITGRGASLAAMRSHIFRRKFSAQERGKIRI